MIGWGKYFLHVCKKLVPSAEKFFQIYILKIIRKMSKGSYLDNIQKNKSKMPNKHMLNFSSSQANANQNNNGGIFFIHKLEKY